MKKALIGGAAVLALAGGGALAAAQASSPDNNRAQTLHVVAPVKGSVTTPTEDLTQFRGPLTDSGGQRVGHLQGYCVTINDDSGAAECTTTLFVAGGQITLTGPTYDRDVHASFRQAVVGGTDSYENARGQAVLTLRANKNVDYLVHVIP